MTAAPDRPPRIAIVGPTHPHSGGIAQHTTRAAHELAAAGADVVIESWRAQYPAFLRKGLDEVPRDRPEIPEFTAVRERLAWYSPVSWARAGRRLRDADLVLLTLVTPFHAVPYAVLRLFLGRSARVGAIVHNVLPHEPSPVDRALVKRALRGLDTVVVHSTEQASVAHELGVDPARTVVRELPFPGIATPALPPAPAGSRRDAAVRLLFFGMVRHYKGVDLLIDALADVDELELRVAGHFWEPVEQYREQVERLGLQQRVELLPGYVDADQIEQHLAWADVLVLPYRTATASYVSAIGRASGRPVIVTRTGALADDVADDVDGLVIEPDDVAALVDALRRVRDHDEVARLAEGTRTRPDPSAERWHDYASGIIERAVRS